jgi:hypothetical protein
MIDELFILLLPGTVLTSAALALCRKAPQNARSIVSASRFFIHLNGVEIFPRRAVNVVNPSFLPVPASLDTPQLSFSSWVTLDHPGYVPLLQRGLGGQSVNCW